MNFLGDHVAYAFTVVVVALVGIIVLTALGDDIPRVLADVVIFLAGGGAGLATTARTGARK